MTFDPMTFPLEADLSRADVRLLYEFCQGKTVVEFGCGGSTVLLAQFAAKVSSYDTDRDWINRTARRLEREPKPDHARPTLTHYTSFPPRELPKADVYFIDGYVPDRVRWVKLAIEERLTETIVVHDSRSSAMSDIGPMLTYPLTMSLRSLTYHLDGSNMLVIRAGAPVEYVNWNAAEPAYRLPFLS